MDNIAHDLSLPEQAEQIGKNYFKQGLNCTECVMSSFMDLHETNYSRDIIGLATGFGGGMGDTKNTCGAIIGAVMALSAVLGRRNPLERETVGERVQELRPIYAVVGEMVKEMEAHYGTLICSELSAPLGTFEGKARKKNCMEIIGYCSALVMKYALETQEVSQKE